MRIETGQGEVLVEGGGFFFVGLFAEVELDFVGVHFFGAGFFCAGDFQAFGADPGGLFTVFGHLVAQGRARGEVCEALEGEELGGIAILVGGDLVSGNEDGVVGLFAEVGFFAGFDLIEIGEGEIPAGGQVRVDFLQASCFREQELERFARDLKAKALGARLGDASDDIIVFLGADPLDDLIEFSFGEGGESTLFSHKTKG